MNIKIQFKEQSTGMNFLKELFPRVATFDGDVMIDLNGRTYSLDEVLHQGAITVQDIRTQAEFDYERGICSKTLIKDGGSSIYRYPSYTLYSGRSMSQDSGIIIGPSDFHFSSKRKREFLSEQHLAFDVRLISRENGFEGICVVKEILPYVATLDYDVLLDYSFDELPLKQVLTIGYLSADMLLRRARTKVEKGLGEIEYAADGESRTYHMDDYSMYEHIVNGEFLGIIIGAKNMQIRWD